MTLLLISFCPCWSARQSNSSIVTVQPFKQCFLTAGAGKRADQLNSFSLFKYNIGRLTFRCLGHTSVKGHTLRHIPDLSVCLDLCAALHTYHIEPFSVLLYPQRRPRYSRLPPCRTWIRRYSPFPPHPERKRHPGSQSGSHSQYPDIPPRSEDIPPHPGNVMRSFAVPSFTVHSAISALFFAASGLISTLKHAQHFFCVSF